MRRFLTAGLTVFLLLAARPSWARVDLYLGFMDEEVKDILATLIKQHPDRRVIVIERGAKVEPNGSLFELPIAGYGGGEPSILRTTGGLEGDSLEAGLAREIKRALGAPAAGSRLKDAAVFEGKNKPKTAREGAVDPTITVVGFNRGARADNPIVVLRSPEMGLQPGLVSAYLEPLIGAVGSLKAARMENGGLNASVYGTGGAISSAFSPGDVSAVKGSVYVGAELIPGSRPPAYRGVIALTDGRRPASRFLAGAPTESAQKAAELAAKAFAEKGAGALKAIDGPLTGRSLKESVWAIDPRGKGTVSLTLSFFGGEEMKTAGRSLGLGDVNMEDFHALEALRGRAHTIDAVRLNCDPHEIRPEVQKLVTDWAKTARYKLSTYEDAIIFGLKGNRVGQLPDSAGWDALKGLPEAELRRLALATKAPSGKTVVLDPFFSEIATDFLGDAANGELFTSSVGGKVVHYGALSRRVTDGLSAQELAALDEIMMKKSAEVRKMAKEIRDNAKVWDEAALRGGIRKMMLAAAEVEVPEAEGPLRGRIAELLKQGPNSDKLDYFRKTGRLRLLGAANSGSAGADTPMEIWLRSAKWKDNTARLLDHLLAEPILGTVDPHAGTRGVDHEALSGAAEKGELSGSNVDRALYKVTIVPGTQLTSPERAVRESARMEHASKLTATIGKLVTELELKGVDSGRVERIKEQLLAGCR